MVFNGGKLFLCLQNISENLGELSGHIFPYIRVSTHGHVQNIGQNPSKPFLPISIFWNISVGNILNKGKF